MNFYNFSHFMQVWIFPPGLILAICIIAFIFKHYHYRSARYLYLLAFILLWAFSTPVITQKLLQPLQEKYPPLQLKNLAIDPENSAIIILGAGIDEAKEYKNGHILSAMTFERLHFAAHLYHQTRLPIIVSGGNKDDFKETEAGLMQHTLKESYQIPIKGMEDKSRNTEEESQFIRPLLLTNHIQTIYLVTHAWHMTRSMYAFQQALKKDNITVIPAPTGFINLLSSDDLANYLPSIKALTASTYALHEYVGMIWYRLKSIYKS